MITPDILQLIAPSITGARAASISEGLKTICPLYGIDTPDKFHEFIANVLHESGEFKDLVESLNYSSTALLQKFSRHRISATDCEIYGRTNEHKANVVEIANRIYGGDWGRINLGNTMPGDGWLFRGSGPIQNTGRKNITDFTVYYNNKFGKQIFPEIMANLLRIDIEIGIHSACWFFAIAKGLIQAAVDDKMELIVKRINGGYNGLPDRIKYYEIAKKYIV